MRKVEKKIASKVYLTQQQKILFETKRREISKLNNKERHEKRKKRIMKLRQTVFYCLEDIDTVLLLISEVVNLALMCRRRKAVFMNFKKLMNLKKILNFNSIIFVHKFNGFYLFKFMHGMAFFSILFWNFFPFIEHCYTTYSDHH